MRVNVKTADSSARGAASWLLLAGIRFYQAVFAHLMPVGCKFYPSCSHYAAEAIERHGAARGARLALGRLWRCRPFTQGGFDPVPDAAEVLSNPAVNPESKQLFRGAFDQALHPAFHPASDPASDESRVAGVRS